MDGRALLAFNTRVLQLHDPGIVELLDSCPSVAVYRFNDESDSWVSYNAL
jgi:hypothetical protein